ncbi:hypothetical protein [Filimonas effusa]|uniref:Uncharacterized protein n=1 Tax=Filimonas effusa TaxID=2508721 RepID=A0A4Q1DC39_9BACT|nr:hypothetical protein [Filimonas effusa]RXK87017.1 hypothetical protein ESB13_09605 [Filimonas effusa]
MFNPFLQFDPRLIQRFREANRRWLISQSYDRGNSVIGAQDKTALLFSDYQDKGLAIVHLDALKAKKLKDRFAVLIDLEFEQHRDRIKAILQPDSGYSVFTSYTSDNKLLQKQLDNYLAKHVERYIKEATSWRISRDSRLRPTLQVIFGELFVTIKFGREQRQVRLSDIEKY